MPSPNRWKRLRRRLYRVYYRIKYFPFAKERRQRRKTPRGSAYPSDERGFVAIQIDALSYDDLVRALERGFAPNIARLLRRGAHDLRPYPAGLPSATPAAQAAIFYGVKDDIPAFRFYEKKDGRVIIGSRTADVQRMRDRLPRDGILSGGSGYVNIFDGGADRAVYTLAAKRRQRFLEKMGGGRLALLALLHPVRMLRMVLASMWEYVLEEWNRLVSQVKGAYTYYFWYIPLLHIGSNVVLREMQTLAVLLDIYVGVPAIYTTFNSYDEYAHHFGPRSRAAFAAVRALDRRVGEILRMIGRAPGRPYDVIILSDHGQTPALPYRLAYGETLGDTLVSAARHGVLVMAGTGDYGSETQETIDFLTQELETVSEQSSFPARKLGLRIGRWLRSQYKVFPLVAEIVKVADRVGIVATYSSSLAHVYWTKPERPLSLDEIRADPDKLALYLFLVAHEGIGAVITRVLDGAHVETMHGRALVTPSGGYEVLQGDDPLRNYGVTEIECQAIAKLVHYSNAGDLVLFGAYDPERDRCICFDDQVGAHGALGGAQGRPFLITPKDFIPAGCAVEDPIDLHPLFARYAAVPANR